MFYGHSIVEYPEGRIKVDGVPVAEATLREAKDVIRQQRILTKLKEEMQAGQYSVVPPNKVAEIIREHHENVRISDKLIEGYVELASSKTFTTDPVVQGIRRFNRLDKILENHIDYVLEDGSTVVIAEATQEKLNSLIGQHQNVVQYMRESKDAFLHALNTLVED